MPQITVGILVGSLRRESINRKLVHAVMKFVPDVAFRELRIDDLPPFNQDEENTPGPAVKRLKEEIAATHGLIFATPEYNRSMPGVLKNAIDHASRPYGKSAWTGKPAGILSASIGSIGGAVAQQHLRNTLAYLDMPTFGQPEAFIHVRSDFFDAAGGIANADSAKFLKAWMDRYCAWLRKFSQ